MVIAVTGGFNISAATATTGIFSTNTYQFGDDLTVVHGQPPARHRRQRRLLEDATSSHARSGGNWIDQRPGHGPRARGLSGGARREASSTAAQRPCRWTCSTSGLYAQDTWRVDEPRRRSTAGVRWEPYFGQQRDERRASTIFNMDNFRKGVKSKVFVNAPAGFSIPATRVSRRQDRAEEAVAEFVAARRLGVGCQRTTAARPCALRTESHMTSRAPSATTSTPRRRRSATGR